MNNYGNISDARAPQKQISHILAGRKPATGCPGIWSFTNATRYQSFFNNLETIIWNYSGHWVNPGHLHHLSCEIFVMAVSMRSALINPTRTKVCDLAPVSSPRVIIDTVSSWAWTHLPSTHTYWIDVRPPPLWVLAIHPCGVFERIERILESA